MVCIARCKVNYRFKILRVAHFSREFPYRKLKVGTKDT